jgi:hypothetical protein
MAIARREPSGPHQGTILYGAHFLDKESSPSDGGSSLGPELPAPPPPLGRETMLRPSLLRVPFSGVRSLFTPRGRRGLAGVGLAVALALGVWMSMQGGSQVRAPSPAPVVNARPPASEPATPPPLSAVEQATPVVPAETAEPLLLTQPTPPVASAVATGEHSRHSGGGAVMRGRTQVAVREARKGPLPRKQWNGSGLEPPPLRAGASAREAVPRAGRLSEDDF